MLLHIIAWFFPVPQKISSLDPKNSTTHPHCMHFFQAQQDIVLEEYEQFDDYLEMVVQFGVSVFYRFLCENLHGLHLVIFNAYVEDKIQNFLSLLFIVSC